MESLIFILLAIAAIALFVVIKLLWAWYRLRSHPHVESIEVANPEVAADLNALIAEVAAAAGIAAPPLYIRRAALPNAFIVAAIIRPELYLTDELLEECDGQADGLHQLMHTICHEIAHIKRGDAIKLGILTWLTHTVASFSMNSNGGIFQCKIELIEDAANVEADSLMVRL